MPVTFIKMQQGVGLVEVLVATAVFSVGVMGTFAMQIAAKKTNFEAAQQLIATSLARDILTRMRSNPGELDSYVVDGIGDTVLVAGTNCRTVLCTATQLAAYDLFEWTSSISGNAERVDIDGQQVKAGGLVSPRACIKHDKGAVEVTIAFKSFNTVNIAGGSECGESSGLYGAGNEQRNVLVMTSYIGAL
jgi:type IV pilus assembly protein PilV